jgi:sortase A
MDIAPPPRPQPPKAKPAPPIVAKPAPRLAKKSRWRIPLLVLGILSLVVGAYLMIILLAPRAGDNGVQEALANPQQNRIVIPKAEINAEILTGDASVLEKGAWHRFPERGDPEKGGNFIVTAHRFKFAADPWSTKKRSTFYDIGRVEVGDEVVVHWNQREHKYKVVKLETVKPDQISIEDPSDEPKLTVYSCTFGGEHDGREVVVAEPI